MNAGRRSLGFMIAAMGMLAALVLPLSSGAAVALSARPILLMLALAAALLFAIAAWTSGRRAVPLGLAGALCGAATTLELLRDESVVGSAAAGYWAMVLAVWLGSALAVIQLASLRPRDHAYRRALNLAVPLVFGAVVFYLWEVSVRGFGISPVIMPAPSAAVKRFIASLPILGGDFVQTFVRGVLIGYALGCGAGLAVAVVAQRFAFLGRGLLPLGNFFSALPLVGVAPIMVMWFGFDWPSKAAVVTLVTFFPMLVNALAGLSASGHMERDLMRSYGASHRQMLTKLDLPAALPFIFNALKINATLALIGAIVAEFFGTPTQGIGFRISTEAGRMALDMVWAEIALAALAGMAFYGLIALAERATTFWHPSYRT
jgi:NitT/TauT family transport system permease protein